MFTQKHVVAIRSALRFWNEEMAPHGSEAAESYLDSDNQSEQPTQKDFSELESLFRSCEVRYVRLTKDGVHVAGTQLTMDPSEQASTIDASFTAVVLVFADEPDG